MKARFFALAALVLGLASCTQDVDTVKPAGGEVDFQLSVAAPELAQTRAGDAEDKAQNAYDSAYGAIDYLQGGEADDAYRYDWSDVNLRYTLEVYDKADKYDGATPVKDRMVIIVDEYEPVTFDLRLVPNRDYHFAVFADFVPQTIDGVEVTTDAFEHNATAQADLGLRHYIGGTLETIVVKNDAINDEVADAYFATLDVNVKNAKPEKIVLKRPYAKLRVIATDLAELNTNVDPAKLVVSYDAAYATKFNAITGEISEKTSATEHTVVYNGGVSKLDLSNHTYTAGWDAEKATSAAGVERHTHMTLMADYILAENEQEPIHFEIFAYDKDGGLIKHTNFDTDIPVQRNYLTTVIGNVLTTATHIEVSIDDNFAGEYVFGLWDGESTIMPEYDAENKTYIVRDGAQLAWVAASVNGTLKTRAAANTFEGYTVKLANDIHLNGELWEPIGSTGLFKGTFDGNGHKIEGLFVYTEGNASAGLFATNRGLIKNLTVVNSEVYGHYKTAVIVADGLCSRVEGCTVDNCVVVSTPYNKDDANNVGAITGYLSAEPTAYVKDCVVKNTQVTAYRKVGGVVGAANGAAEVTGNTVQGTTVTADMTAEYKEDKPADVGSVVGWQHTDAVVKDNTPVSGPNTANVNAVKVFVKIKDGNDINKNSDFAVVIPEGEYTFTEDVKSQSIQVREGEVEITAGNVETGNANQYGFVAEGENTSLVINDANIDSKGGGIGANSGAQVTFKNGKLAVNSGSTSGRYLFYVVGEGTVVTIDGGEFSFSSTLNQKRAYVYTGAGAKVIINGGTFGKASTRSGYTDGILGNGETIIYGGTFGFDPTRWVAAGCTVKKEGANWVVTKGTPATTSAELKDSIDKMEEGETVVVAEGNYGAFPKVGKNVTIYCEEGTVFEGKSGLSINGSTVVGATFSNPGDTAATSTINGSFKDCDFVGGNGLRWAYAGETCYFENCLFEGSLYGAHFDGGANDVTYKNCVLSGFNAFAGAITQLTFDGCTFKDGPSAYNGANLWGSTTFKNCEFTFDGSASTEWIDCISTTGTYKFENCTINGVPYTAENYKDFLDYIWSRNDITVKINGTDCELK